MRLVLRRCMLLRVFVSRFHIRPLAVGRWGKSCTEKRAALIVRCRVVCVCRREVECDGDTDDRVCKKGRPLYIQGIAMCGMSNVSAG